ncbi:FAD-dependent monooxygenase [Novosphingobium colocasiae]|uniref:Monooxygenase n=1 Tax=Novosphingobium colocasiae TaxID=1256513 RepID=A0A918UD01_9SPHN|nr:FAD-dependent monooxygenase [Novosphingobium colocasiae]GGY91127.1 monooxygenase [Novosphingobium colocasiae]
MPEVIEVPVLVVGGGPVGLTMAIELSHYGVGSLVIERNASTTRHPKMDLTNGRCMDLFRRTGVADRIRAAGVDQDNSYDIVWTTDLKPGSHELHRFCYPGNRAEYWRRRNCNDGTLSLEAPLRVSQILIEPVLRDMAEACADVDVRFGHRLESFVDGPDGIVATVINEQTGETLIVRAGYLAACDGGNSTVRKQLGVDSDGMLGAAHMYLVHFRSRDYELLHQFGQAWHYQTGWGQIVAQDDVEQWTLHCLVPPDAGFEAIDPRRLVIDLMGKDFDFEVLVANPVTLNYQVAHQYRVGRAFLVGDAAHQFVPTGGYGMNTGIPEAANLGWKIAAAVHGWGGDALLQSYHDERQPIAHISRATSERHLGIRAAIYRLYAEAGDLAGTGPEAEAARSRMGHRIGLLGNIENEAWGTEQGYRYESSPVIPDEPGYPPAFDMLTVKPSTWPGRILPHVYLEDGTAVFDRLGKWFTLLVLDGSDAAPLAAAAEAAGLPLDVLHLNDAVARRVYEKPLVLVRPDHHVAWRGDSLPAGAGQGSWRIGQPVESCADLIDLVRGV